MGVKVVILIMSIILVVGLRTREVKANANAFDDRKMLTNTHIHTHVHVHSRAAHGRNHARAHAHAHVQAKGGLNIKGGRSMKFNNDLMPAINNANSLKIVNDLCATATYKDACVKSLSSLTPKCGNSPYEFFKSGLQLALDETTKASKLPNTLVPQAASANKRVNSALETCTDLLEQAIDRLKMASDQVNAGDPSKTLKDPSNIFNVRLELSDVNTFSTNCLDEFTEAQAAPEIQKTMQDGIVNAQQLAVNMLDIISTYTF